MINKNIVLFILVGIISIWLGFFAFDNVTMRVLQKLYLLDFNFKYNYLAHFCF